MIFVGAGAANPYKDNILEPAMNRTYSGWKYWLHLLVAALLSVLIAFAGTITWISYRQGWNYLHPARHIATGSLLQASGIEFQDIELLTQDNVRLSAWYTPPKNGAVILVAHGYGDKRA